MGLQELSIVLLSASIHSVWSLFIKGSRSPLAFNLLQSVPTSALALGLVPFVELGEAF